MLYSMFLVAAFVLCLLAKHGHAVCSSEEERKFVAEILDEDCRSKLSLLNFRNPAIRMDENELDVICTPSCLGKYSSWLVSSCNNTAKAWFQRAACLRQQDNQGNKRCRFFFPDFTNISSTRQCVVLFADKTVPCTVDCRAPLQHLIARLGCCFETIYDNKLVTKGLHKEGFLINEEYTALNLFQSSSVLSRCIDPRPQPCIGEAFPFGDGNPSGGIGSRLSRLYVVSLTVVALVLIILSSFI